MEIVLTSLDGHPERILESLKGPWTILAQLDKIQIPS